MKITIKEIVIEGQDVELVKLFKVLTEYEPFKELVRSVTNSEINKHKLFDRLKAAANK